MINITSFSSSILTSGSACIGLGEVINLYNNAKPERDLHYFDLAAKVSQLVGGLLLSSGTLAFAGYTSAANALLALSATPLITRTIITLSNSSPLNEAVNTLEKYMRNTGRLTALISSIALPVLGFSFTLPATTLTFLIMPQALEGMDYITGKEKIEVFDEKEEEEYVEDVLYQNGPQFEHNLKRTRAELLREMRKTFETCSRDMNQSLAETREEFLARHNEVSRRVELFHERTCAQMEELRHQNTLKEQAPSIAEFRDEFVLRLEQRQEDLSRELQARHNDVSFQLERGHAELRARMQELENKDLMDGRTERCAPSVVGSDEEFYQESVMPAQTKRPPTRLASTQVHARMAPIRQTSAVLMSPRLPNATAIRSGQTVEDPRFEWISEHLKTRDPNSYQVLFENDKFINPHTVAGGKFDLPAKETRINLWRKVERRYNLHTDFYTYNLQTEDEANNLLNVEKVGAKELAFLFRDAIKTYWRKSEEFRNTDSSLAGLTNCMYEQEIQMYELIPEFIRAVVDREAFLEEAKEVCKHIILEAREKQDLPLTEEDDKQAEEKDGNETLDSILQRVHS